MHTNLRGTENGFCFCVIGILNCFLRHVDAFYLAFVSNRSKLLSATHNCLTCYNLSPDKALCSSTNTIDGTLSMGRGKKVPG